MLETMGIYSTKNKRSGRFNTSGGIVRQIPVKQIFANPNQPRQIFTPDNLKELADSIRIYGVIQPITVRKLASGDYELISGERRVRAAAMAGLSKVPAIVMVARNIDSALVALIENVQRCDLTFLEEAHAYYRLITEFGYTQEQLAIKLGKNQSTVANKVRLLKLPEAVRITISDYHLTERHARALLRISDAEMQSKVLNEILEKGLNVRQTDDLVDKVTSGKEQPAQQKGRMRVSVIKDVRIFNNTVKKAVGMMLSCGIKTESKQKEYEDRYEYHICIYK